MEENKRKVPVLTLEEYKKIASERKLSPGNYKIRKEDAEEFIKFITK